MPPLTIRRRGTDVLRVLLDELAARLDLVAHQHREDPVGGGRVLDLDARSASGSPGSIVVIHELLGVHLAEALEAARPGCPPSRARAPASRSSSNVSAVRSFLPSASVNGGGPTISTQPRVRLAQVRVDRRGEQLGRDDDVARGARLALDDLIACDSSGLLERPRARSRSSPTRHERSRDPCRRPRHVGLDQPVLDDEGRRRRCRSRRAGADVQPSNSCSACVKRL